MTKTIRSAARSGLLALGASALLVSGCATQQQNGALIGGALAGLVANSIAGTGGRFVHRGRPHTAAIVLATAAGAFAGSVIGASLDEGDRRRAEAASRQSLAERDAAVRRALDQRNAEIERQLQAELAAARSSAARAEAENRATQERLAARDSAESMPGPKVAWDGKQNGFAQATGRVAGRPDCEQVREIAYIAGRETPQTATYCRDGSGGRVRAA